MAYILRYNTTTNGAVTFTGAVSQDEIRAHYGSVKPAYKQNLLKEELA